MESEVKEIVDSSRMTGLTQDAKRTALKFIIECYYLTDEEKKIACEIIRERRRLFYSKPQPVPLLAERQWKTFD